MPEPADVPLHRVEHSDALTFLRSLPDCSVDALVSDPPYGLSQHGADDVASCLTAWLAGDEYQHSKAGFMGRTWDSWVPGPEVWRECLRVLKPGGHACIFAGTRTVDLMGIALRLAGFEIRDSLHWIYGTGFPKSHNVGKAIDKAAGAEREVVGTNPTFRPNKQNHSDNGWRGMVPGEAAVVSAPATPEAAQWEGWGTALKPAHEPIILARKPLSGTVAANVLRHGTGGLNVDGCRVATDGDARPLREPIGGTGDKFGAGLEGGRAVGTTTQGRWPPNIILTHATGCRGDKNGAGCVDGCAVGEMGAQSGVTQGSGGAFVGRAGVSLRASAASGGMRETREPGIGDTGTAARFFPSFHYCPKASRSEREAGLEAPADGKRANRHPTVKPIDLMRWLVRLVTPPGGVVLDPFTGSGTTGCAAALEGFAF
ncbi:MAG: site-specific DNA-methyltransferase, partial [Myxococcales bacterium]|nr:site-specific DNA-methyltransferase [Myxococcales bacterium]